MTWMELTRHGCVEEVGVTGEVLNSLLHLATVMWSYQSI